MLSMLPLPRTLDAPGRQPYSPAANCCPGPIPLLDKIFTWWSGATLGALNTIRKRAVFVGEDAYGNRYFEAKDTRDSYDGRKRRWVIYRGYAEATKIPPDWHG